ncbi:MAG: hypothetical protein ACE15F_00560 [bacterium]
MLSQVILYLFSTPALREYLDSLSSIAWSLIEAIAWILLAGGITMGIHVARRMLLLLRLRGVARVIQNTDWQPLAIPQRFAQLKPICKPAAGLRWAVETMERLSSRQYSNRMEEVIDLCVARYRPPEIYTLLPRLAIMTGLMGTLIGLLIAVQDVYLKVESLDSIDSLRAPLHSTLSGLSTAFVTTLAGVFAAAVLSPLLVLTRWSSFQVINRLDALLSTEILPLVTPPKRARKQTLGQMVEKVSRAVVENTMGGLVRETAAGVNELSVRLAEAVNAAASRQADMHGVVFKLEQAGEGLQEAAGKIHGALGQLNEYLLTLTQTIARLTPEAEIREQNARLLGAIVKEELSELGDELRRFNADWSERLRQFPAGLEPLGILIDKAVKDLRDDLGSLPSRVIAHLQPITEQLKDLNVLAQNEREWWRARAGKVPEDLSQALSRHLEPLQAAALEALRNQTARLDEIRGVLEPFSGVLERIVQRIEEGYLSLPTVSVTTPAGEAPEPAGTAGANLDEIKAGLWQLGQQSLRTLTAVRESANEYRQMHQDLRQLIGLLQPDRRPLWRRMRSWIQGDGDKPS